MFWRCIPALPLCTITLTARTSTKPLAILNTLGDYLKKRRLEFGLLQRDVAKILGVDTCTVTNWEKNHTKPMLRLLPKIVEFLGYDPMPGNPKTLGEEALQYRRSKGMTQKELAKRMGIDPTTLSRLERNRGRCSPSVLTKVSAFLASNHRATAQTH